MARVKPVHLLSVNNRRRSVVGRGLLELDASSDGHQEVLHLAVLRLLQELREGPALPLGHPPTGLWRWGRRIRAFAQMPDVEGLWRQRQHPAAAAAAVAWRQRGGRGAEGRPRHVAVLRHGSAGEAGMFRHGGGLDRDHGGLDGDGAKAEAPGGSPKVRFGGRRPPDGGDSRGDHGGGVGGQAGGGRRTFGLKHAAVRLTDVAAPGDGGGFIKV